MKKKLLFIIPEFSHGGTNKSLENLLTFMDKEKYDIHVFCIHEDGSTYYKKKFCHYIVKKSFLYYLLHDNQITRKVMGLYNKLTKRNNFTFLYKHEVNWLQKKHHFDIVIAYQELKSTEIATYIKGVKRIAWVQCDYPELVGNKRYAEDLSYYNKYNKIICVSKYAANSFRHFFNLSDELVTYLYNTIDINYIQKKSALSFEEFDNKLFNIISVGRLSKEKQFEKIPEILYKLGDSCNNIMWYIIGDGYEKDAIVNEAAKYGMQSHLVMMGAKTNPYPYIKNADLLVCTSKSESFSYVIAEAKILHTPIVTNNFPVAYEVLDKNCGWICPLNDMPELINSLINDKNEEYSKVKKSIMNYEYPNKEIICKIDQLFN